MSLFCAISGQSPLHPVLSKSGHVYEKNLIVKYLKENGKEPITGEELTEDELVDIKTAPAAPGAPPRPPNFTSVPSILHVLQNEWDAVMLECLELRKLNTELRQELSHALYKEDAAMRVLARVLKEKEEARKALASIQSTLGQAVAVETEQAGDVEMEEEPTNKLPEAVVTKIQTLQASLTSTRKKRIVPEGSAKSEDVKNYTQNSTVTSMHGTKPAGVATVALAKEGNILVTGGLDKNVILYDRNTGKNLANLKGHTKKVTKTLASQELVNDIPAFVVSSSLDSTVRVWTPNGNKTVYGGHPINLESEVNSIALHPTGDIIVAALADGAWEVVDLSEPASPSSLLKVATADEGVSNTSIAVHPDGGLVAVGGSDSKIRVFDIITGNQVGLFDHEGGAVNSLSFSERGNILTTSAVNSSLVRIWNLSKMTNVHSIDLGENKVNVVEWDHSADLLAVAGTDLKVFKYKTYEEVFAAAENSNDLTGVAWGPLGQELVVVGLDRTARIFSAPSE